MKFAVCVESGGHAAHQTLEKTEEVRSLLSFHGFSVKRQKESVRALRDGKSVHLVVVGLAIIDIANA